MKNYLKETFGNIHQKGYKYIIDSMEYMVLNNMKTMYIYEMVAKKNNTTPSRVERAMRHYRDTIIKQQGMEKVYTELGYPFKDKMTNMKFLILIYLKMVARGIIILKTEWEE